MGEKGYCVQEEGLVEGFCEQEGELEGRELDQLSKCSSQDRESFPWL